jgi:TIR domain
MGRGVMMEGNPLEQKAPEDPIERVHEFARDLAYGALKGYWDSKITIDESEKWDYLAELARRPDDEKFHAKWNTSVPSFSLLVSFEYLDKIAERGKKSGAAFTIVDTSFEVDYVLTPKAFALLEKPTNPPKIFISYARKHSSPLALLIEARLKLEDRRLGVFIDKDTPLGEEWRDTLKERIESCEYFICLLTAGTLVSKPVSDEITIAIHTPDCKIIPICHNGYDFEKPYSEDLFGNRIISPDTLETLSTKNALIVETESAASYEDKINRLLNRLGYSTVK